MSRRYTAEEKKQILDILDENLGNIVLTALQTSIPARTLYTWRQELQQKPELPQSEIAAVSRENPELPQSNLLPPPPQEGEYTRIRRLLMHHILRLTNNLSEDPDTVNIRAIALTRLLDRAIKLEALTRIEHPPTVKIRFTRAFTGDEKKREDEDA